MSNSQTNNSSQNASDARAVGGGPSWKALVFELVSMSASYALLFVGLRALMKSMDPSQKQKRAAEEDRKKLIQKLIANGRQPFAMDDYESIIASDMVYPEDIDVTFDQIGGLEYAKEEIYNLVALPLRRPDLFAGQSRLIASPKGILLYGPPGTGKTMMAKAIARESGAAFINLKMSTTMNKWFGESQKLVRATFSLAKKLAPCIVFIDEVDSFLRERSSDDNAALGNMKAEFMALWDGLTTAARNHTAYGVIVIGATNRPWDVDPAILRRMPRAFELGLPKAPERLAILKKVLGPEALDNDLINRIVHLSEFLEGYSGSDIKELCKAAAMIPFREYCDELRNHKLPAPTPHLSHDPDHPDEGDQGNTTQEHHQVLKPRPLSYQDFITAAKTVRPTGDAAREYQENTTFNPANANAAKQTVSPRELTQLLQQMGGQGVDVAQVQKLLTPLIASSGGQLTPEVVRAYILGLQQSPGFHSAAPKFEDCD